MKVLIADDEPKIRRGLSQLLQKSQLELTLIEPVKNGELALQAAKEEKPDILLVDICMPKLNGLALIKALKSILPRSKIIVITGHDEFQYAHEAIKLGVTDYLLKPIDEMELINLLRSIQEEHLLHVQKEKYYHWIDGELNRHLLAIKTRFFINWYQGFLEPSEIKDTLQHLCIEVSSPMNVKVIGTVPFFDLHSEDWHMDTLLFAVSNIAMEIYDAYGITAYLFLDDSDQIILLSTPNRDISEEGIDNKISQCVKKHLNHSIIIASQSLTEPMIQLPEIYENLSSKINHIQSCSQPVRDAKEYIDRYYSEDNLSLQMVADYLNITPSYLSRLMKQELGVSFIDYLTKIRLNKAMQILERKDSNFKMYEIALKIGYTSQHYFCKVFKKKYGISPSDYKKYLHMRIS